MNITRLTEDLGISPWLFAALVLWSLVWKGLALWHSARREQRVWFIVLLLVNTAGVLEIIYLFAVAKIGRQKESASQQ